MFMFFVGMLVWIAMGAAIAWYAYIGPKMKLRGESHGNHYAKWSKWSDPEEARLADRTGAILAQKRTCLECNIIEWRSVRISRDTVNQNSSLFH